jgi:DMSO/TMAO reductase YedYZ molybdopterin-dependent catalytic subunit
MTDAASQHSPTTPTNPGRLTPGQKTALPTLAVTGERAAAPFRLEDWRLRVHGLVAHPLELTLDQVRALGAEERVWDTICVTGWTHFGTRWRGVPLRAVLDRAAPQPAARFVRFVAHSLRRHDTSLPIEYAREHTLVAWECDGQPLSPEHGFPLRSVTAGKYFYKSLKWLTAIELLAEDRLGYWEETSAYHNHADPEREERYVPRVLGEGELDDRIARRDFSGVLAIADPQFTRLRERDLDGADFRGARIKSCRLTRVSLRGAQCAGANFTRSFFTGSDLSGADLSGCDLEGASFVNCDLRGADLRGASLTMASFVHDRFGARIEGARFRVEDIERDGVDEGERRYLLDPSRGAWLE